MTKSEETLDKLSERERQVLIEILDGKPNKIIANNLFITERTVKYHCTNIYEKLKIANRRQLFTHCYSNLYQGTGFLNKIMCQNITTHEE